MTEFKGNERVTIKAIGILLVLWNPMAIAGVIEASYNSNDTIALTEQNFDDELGNKALMVMFYAPG